MCTHTSYKLSSDLRITCTHIHRCTHTPTSCLWLAFMHAHTYTDSCMCTCKCKKKRKQNPFTMLSTFTSFFLIPDGVVGDRVRFSKAERKIQHAGMLSLLYEWTVWPSAFNEHLYCFQFFAVTGGLCDHSHVWLLMFLLYSSFSCMSRNGTAGFSCMLALTGNVQPVWGSCIHSQSWQ